MKKRLSFAVAICLMICLFSGCIQIEFGETAPLTTKGSTEHVDQTNLPTNEADESDDHESLPTIETSETIEKVDTEETISKAVLIDEGGIKITVTGMKDGWMGKEIKLLVENTTDKNIALTGGDFIVNGVTIAGYLYIDVAAGKKSNGEISLHSEALEMAGIEHIATIHAVDAHVIDKDEYETIMQTPLKITTSIAGEWEQRVDESGDIIFQEAGVTVIAKIVSDEIFGKTLILFTKNESDKDIVLEADNVSVNGFTLSAFMYDTVYAGTVRFCEMGIFSSELEENEIEVIEDVTFTLLVVNPKNYDLIAQSDELQVFVGK